MNREVNNVVSRTSENCLDITEIVKNAGEDKDYFKSEIELVRNTFNDNLDTNIEKINIKLTEARVYSDTINQEILKLQEYNTDFSSKTSDNFNKTNEN